MKLNYILTTICWVLLPMLTWARGKDKPNIVFIISDQHKKAALSCYGDELAVTPHIDGLAATGVMLNNCYAAAPVCAPSRAALTTGMYPVSNGAPYHKAPIKASNGQIENVGTGRLRQTGYHENLTTLPEIFRQNGFITGSPGKMHVHGELQKEVDPMYPEGNDMGYDEVNVRYYTHFPGGHYQDEVGRDAYERYRIFGKYIDLRKDLNLNTTYSPSLVENDEDNFDMVVTRKSIEFIEERAKNGENFFLHVGLENHIRHLPLRRNTWICIIQKILNCLKPLMRFMIKENFRGYLIGFTMASVYSLTRQEIAWLLTMPVCRK